MQYWVKDCLTPVLDAVPLIAPWQIIGVGDSIYAIHVIILEGIMIVNLLPEIMKRKGMSIRELSRQTDITYTTIRAFYHGERRSIQLEVLDAVCESLKLQPGEIFRFLRQEEPPSESQIEHMIDNIFQKDNQKIAGPRTGSGSEDWITWE